MTKVYRYTIQLSEFEARKLICWAKAHGKAKATYAAQIIGDRIEAAMGIIEEIMLDIAKHEGICVEDLETRWLEEEGFGGEVEVS